MSKTSSTHINKTKTRLLTKLHPAHALGLAVSYLMNKPAFSCLPFGHWSRILVGQINRDHYLIAVKGDHIVGFLGWALTTKEKGEMWLSEQVELSFENSKTGEVFLINAWAAEANDVTRVFIKHLREIGKEQKMIYFKRLYPNGRPRPGRLRIKSYKRT